MQTEGRLDVEYFCHGDPAKSHCNFSFNIAHIEWVDGMPHVVVDLVEVWRPRDFPKGKIDFMYVEECIKGHIRRFRPAQVTFDQYNFEGGIQRLQEYAHDAGLR